MACAAPGRAEEMMSMSDRPYTPAQLAEHWHEKRP